VTGLDDDSVPWEYFQCVLDWHTDESCRGGDASCRLRSLLHHPRLLHWYTQNLDILPHPNKRLMHATDRVAKCRTAIAGGPRDSNFTWDRDRTLLQKLSPIPIGIRIHTGAARNAIVCRGQQEIELLRAMRREAPPLAARKLRILAAFGPARDRRRAALRELNASTVADLLPLAGGGRASRAAVGAASGELRAQSEFWNLAQQYAFVASPASHGQDTHRFWEALYLGAIPIVLSGPLNGMYRSFPCVIIQSWTEVGRPGQLEKWMADVSARDWDARLLTSAYYAERIGQGLPTFPDFFGHTV